MLRAKGLMAQGGEASLFHINNKRMRTSRHFLRRIWPVTCLVSSAVGLGLSLYGWQSPLSPLFYFTWHANLGWLALTLYRFYRTEPASARGAVTLYQSMVLLIAILLPHKTGSPIADAGTLVLHYVTPLMALVDWLLVEHTGASQAKDAAAWLLYPAGYALMTLTVNSLKNPRTYPYWFLDVTALGSARVGMICVLLAALMYLGGRLLVLADKQQQAHGERYRYVESI